MVFFVCVAELEPELLQAHTVYSGDYIYHFINGHCTISPGGRIHTSDIFRRLLEGRRILLSREHRLYRLLIDLSAELSLKMNPYLKWRFGAMS